MTCRHTCEKAQPCVLPAPTPAPFIAPAHLKVAGRAVPSIQAPTAAPTYLTFARRAVAPVPGPAPAPLACPIGQYMVGPCSPVAVDGRRHYNGHQMVAGDTVFTCAQLRPAAMQSCTNLVPIPRCRGR